MEQENKLVEIYEKEHYRVIVPKENLVDNTIDDFKAIFLKKHDEIHKHVLIDFTQVRMLTSRAMGTLVQLFKILTAMGHKIGIAYIEEEFSWLLQEMKLNTLIPFFYNEAEFVVYLSEEAHTASTREDFRVEVAQEKSPVIISLVPSSSPMSRPQILKTISSVDARHIVVQCNSIPFISAETVKALLALARRVEKSNGKIFAVNVTGPVREYLAIFKYASSLPIIESLADAEAHF